MIVRAFDCIPLVLYLIIITLLDSEMTKSHRHIDSLLRRHSGSYLGPLKHSEVGNQLRRDSSSKQGPRAQHSTHHQGSSLVVASA